MKDCSVVLIHFPFEETQYSQKRFGICNLINQKKKTTVQNNSKKQMEGQSLFEEFWHNEFHVDGWELVFAPLAVDIAAATLHKTKQVVINGHYKKSTNKRSVRSVLAHERAHIECGESCDNDVAHGDEWKSKRARFGGVGVHGLRNELMLTEENVLAESLFKKLDDTGRIPTQDDHRSVLDDLLQHMNATDAMQLYMRTFYAFG